MHHPPIHMMKSALTYNPMDELFASRPNQSGASSYNYTTDDLFVTNDSNTIESLARSSIKAKDFLTISEIADDMPPPSVGYAGSAAASYPVSSAGQRIPFGTGRPSLQAINANAMRRYSISTILAGTLFYSLTILPLIMMLTSTGPFAGFGPPMVAPQPAMMMMGKRRRRRSLPAQYNNDRMRHLTAYRQMPLLDKTDSGRFLSLLQATFALRRLHDSNCRKLYLCEVYGHVLQQAQRPISLHSFEDALVHTFG